MPHDIVMQLLDVDIIYINDTNSVDVIFKVENHAYRETVEVPYDDQPEDCNSFQACHSTGAQKHNFQIIQACKLYHRHCFYISRCQPARASFSIPFLSDPDLTGHDNRYIAAHVCR
jgi:hypothetical protein